MWSEGSHNHLKNWTGRLSFLGVTLLHLLDVRMWGLLHLSEWFATHIKPVFDIVLGQGDYKCSNVSKQVRSCLSHCLQTFLALAGRSMILSGEHTLQCLAPHKATLL